MRHYSTGGALTLTGTYSDPMISAARAAEFPWIFRWSCVLAAANGGGACPSAAGRM
jgi:hypothetical protein